MELFTAVPAGAQHMKLPLVLVNRTAQCFSIYGYGRVGSVNRTAPVAKRTIELLRVDLHQHIANAIDTGALHFAAVLADLENRILLCLHPLADFLIAAGVVAAIASCVSRR